MFAGGVVAWYWAETAQNRTLTHTREPMEITFPCNFVYTPSARQGSYLNRGDILFISVLENISTSLDLCSKSVLWMMLHVSVSRQKQTVYMKIVWRIAFKIIYKQHIQMPLYVAILRTISRRHFHFRIPKHTFKHYRAQKAFSSSLILRLLE